MLENYLVNNLQTVYTGGEGYRGVEDCFIKFVNFVLGENNIQIFKEYFRK